MLTLQTFQKANVPFAPTKLPSHAVDFLRFGCIVDGSRIEQELGYEPRFDLRQTLDAIPAAPSIVE